jgi:hypothetical protein
MPNGRKAKAEAKGLGLRTTQERALGAAQTSHSCTGRPSAERAA